MNVLTLIAGSLCWVVTLLMSVGLLTGAYDDSISAAQAIVMLAVAAGTGWVGYWLLGHDWRRPASLE